jgi:hypothetical protein
MKMMQRGNRRCEIIGNDAKRKVTVLKESLRCKINRSDRKR